MNGQPTMAYYHRIILHDPDTALAMLTTFAGKAALGTLTSGGRNCLRLFGAALDSITCSCGKPHHSCPFDETPNRYAIASLRRTFVKAHTLASQ